MVERNATSAQLEESQEGNLIDLPPPRAQRMLCRRAATLKSLASIGSEGRSTDAEGDEDVAEELLPQFCTYRLDRGSFIDGMLSALPRHTDERGSTRRKHDTASHLEPHSVLVTVRDWGTAFAGCTMLSPW
jgi:hypothetical protein